MTENNTQIVVLSRNYSTGLGVIRSLGEAGYKTDLIASVQKNGSSVICAASKYLNSSIEVLAKDTQRDKGEEIIERLMAYELCSNKKAILFPTDDYTCSIIDSNRDVLEKKYLMPYVDGEGSIRALMDKNYQSEAARKANLTVPMQWLISLKNEISLPDDIVYPVFVKPLSSVSGFKSEMAVCKDDEELKKHLKGMKDSFSDRDVAIQEYLNIEKEYDFSGLCLGDKIIIPGILEKTMVAQHMRGVTISGIMKRVDEIPQMKETIEKVKSMLKTFNYYGMFDMEINLANGKLYFGEINFRTGGPNYAFTLSGANLPKVFVHELLKEGHDVDDEEIKTFGKSFVYEKVAWQDFMNGYLSKEERKAVISNADYTLLANELDPKPGKIFARRIRLSALKHFVLNWRKR